LDDVQSNSREGGVALCGGAAVGSWSRIMPSSASCGSWSQPTRSRCTRRGRRRCRSWPWPDRCRT